VVVLGGAKRPWTGEKLFFGGGASKGGDRTLKGEKASMQNGRSAAHSYWKRNWRTDAVEGDRLTGRKLYGLADSMLPGGLHD